MPLTRYYILENDTTTQGGIVQTTTNPIVFNVGGKKQSCIGDDVWCPACQSMGQIVPSGPRLSFSLGGAMPALNDDLCLCRCNPPPKLVHSQTSFKEIIDDNRLAQYRQAQAQYRQAKLPTTQLERNFIPEDAYDSQQPKKQERFFWENIAMQYLSEYNNNAELAWYAIRGYRDSYKGLKEDVRNAEHYLYALYQVREDSYNWGKMHVMTTGYSITKGVSNAVGHITEAIFNNNISPYRGSPITTGEYLGGYYGTQDGLFGIPE